jgi:hypothetical protein
MREGPVIDWTTEREPRFVGTRFVCSGAEFCEGQWRPTVVSNEQKLLPYRRFVCATLRGLGHDVSA